MPFVLLYQTLSNDTNQASHESQTHVMRLTELKQAAGAQTKCICCAGQQVFPDV